MLALESYGLISGFQESKFVVVLGYSPNEGNGNEMERFWNDLERIMHKIGNGYRLGMLGDLCFLEFQERTITEEEEW